MILTRNNHVFFVIKVKRLIKQVFNDEEKNINLIEVNGFTDHVHILFSINRELSIINTLILIKGESSFLINKNNFCKIKFHWQDDYWAVRVCKAHLNSVKHYIQNQEQHHKKKFFKEEIDHFMNKYDWNKCTKQCG